MASDPDFTDVDVDGDLAAYHTLGVPPDADDEIIRVTYNQLESALNPEKHGYSAFADAALRLIREAYEMVGTPPRRREYDAKVLARMQTIRQSYLELWRTLHQLRRVAADTARYLAIGRRQVEAFDAVGDDKERSLASTLAALHAQPQALPPFNGTAHAARNLHKAWEDLKALCVARHDLVCTEVKAAEMEHAASAAHLQIQITRQEFRVVSDRFEKLQGERNPLFDPAATAMSNDGPSQAQ